MLRSHAMTIGQLSRRSGVPIKVLRKYEDLGFLYTLGRSQSNNFTNTYQLQGSVTKVIGGHTIKAGAGICVTSQIDQSTGRVPMLRSRCCTVSTPVCRSISSSRTKSSP